MTDLRYLLLQTRNADDEMRAQEVGCFAQALGCDRSAIAVFDLLAAAPSTQLLQQVDMILLGGSGHYSAAEKSPPHVEQGPGEAWLDRAFDTLRDVHHLAKPTFASCWGFQAMARALGGRCIHDLPRAELGTIELHLTDAGRDDPLFGPLPAKFAAQAGHEDHVVALPPDAVLLASSQKVPEQAYRLIGKPIYCTQFHPELDRQAMLERVRAYPAYIQRIVGTSYDRFAADCRETPEANTLLRRFIELVFHKVDRRGGVSPPKHCP
jgi:GMP synthase (glutamine-hydrolysing)